MDMDPDKIKRIDARLAERKREEESRKRMEEFDSRGERRRIQPNLPDSKEISSRAPEPDLSKMTPEQLARLKRIEKNLRERNGVKEYTIHENAGGNFLGNKSPEVRHVRGSAGRSIEEEAVHQHAPDKGNHFRNGVITGIVAGEIIDRVSSYESEKDRNNEIK
jgi:hypothetical protein